MGTVYRSSRMCTVHVVLSTYDKKPMETEDTILSQFQSVVCLPLGLRCQKVKLKKKLSR